MQHDLVAIPILSDNYAWVLGDPSTRRALVVDPGEAAPVRAALTSRGWRAAVVLATHHHDDHIAGVLDVAEADGAEIVAPVADRHRLPFADHPRAHWVADGDAVATPVGPGAVIAVPGHTLGHIALHVPAAAALFCGDTLFALGCGRVFESTPEQMWASLERLRALPDETLVCCGHEYTASNARFARTLEPDHPDLAAYADEVAARRADSQPTLPTSLGREKRTNPFLRADDPRVADAVALRGAPPASVFAEVRRRKNLA